MLGSFICFYRTLDPFSVNVAEKKNFVDRTMIVIHMFLVRTEEIGDLNRKISKQIHETFLLPPTYVGTLKNGCTS